METYFFEDSDVNIDGGV